MEDFLAIWLLLALPLSILVGFAGRRKGGSFLAAFVVSLLLSPLIGALVVALHSPRTEVLEARAIKKGKARRCPECKELIQPDARICKHCGHKLGDNPSAG